MALRIAKAAGLALVVLCWAWARYALWSDATAVIVVWCAPLFTFPLAIAGRKVLDAKPIARRAERVTILFHYGTMIALGVGIFRAFRLVGKSPGIAIPFPPSLGMALSIVTGVAMFLSVLNLALRGLGAPFAVRLSTRLATDWMYSWTRNPMLLCTLAWLFSLGLMYRSLWMVAWLAVSV